MTNIIKLEDFKKEKVREDVPKGQSSSQFQPMQFFDDGDTEARLQRIRESIKRINALLEALKINTPPIK